MLTKELGNVSDAAGPRWRDYYLLTKPGVVQLLVFTAIVGMFLAVPGMVPWDVLVLGSLGIGLTAAAAAVVNQVIDQRIDAQMARTRSRPLPMGRVQERDALTFALVLGLVGIGTLAIFVNVLTAVLTFVSLIGYAIIYTVWLKRATPQNIVIGGAAGAFPPMIGWAAATGQVSAVGVALFLLILLWTPPHFWALALYRSDDYRRAGVPMLPVVAGARETKRQMLIYTLLLVPVALAPTVLGTVGWLYGAAAVIMSATFVAHAVTVWRAPDDREGHAPARRMFKFSLLYLAVLFAALPLDQLLGRLMAG